VARRARRRQAAPGGEEAAMSPTHIPPPLPSLGESLARLLELWLYWIPQWRWILFRARVRRIFRTMLGRGPRRPAKPGKSDS
jgi:hypothetical protein